MRIIGTDAEAAGDAALAQGLVRRVEIQVSMACATRNAGDDPERERRGGKCIELLGGANIVAERSIGGVRRYAAQRRPTQERNTFASASFAVFTSP